VPEVVPEVTAYATLSALGLEAARASEQALFGHLDSMRALHGCDRGEALHGDRTHTASARACG
jgi:hypothetical protein